MDLPMPAALGSSNPRRVAAVGVIRQTANGRRHVLTATPFGATGSITRSAGNCRACHGSGGHVDSTNDRGVIRTNWTRCTVCRGTGGAR